jgi:N-formylglutamate deformylase
MKAFFVSIPHSGEQVPPEVEWLHGLTEAVLMCDVDRYVDRLYEDTLNQMKIPFVKTPWHRFVVDLNRLAEDVDQDSVEGSKNPSGKFPMGLHWRVTTQGTVLFHKPLSADFHNQLVKKYFEPFHAQVRAQYEKFRAQGAKTVFQLDAHSMPSMGTKMHRDPGERRADIVVSDCEGVSCDTWYKDLVMSAYKETGLNVAYNWPYMGGRVTQTYGHPEKGQQAIQVEINRDLYMDEINKQWLPEKAQKLQGQLRQAIQTIYQRIPEI